MSHSHPNLAGPVLATDDHMGQVENIEEPEIAGMDNSPHLKYNSKSSSSKMRNAGLAGLQQTGLGTDTSGLGFDQNYGDMDDGLGTIEPTTGYNTSSLPPINKKRRKIAAKKKFES